MRRLLITTGALAASGATTLLFNIVLARVQGREAFGQTAVTLAVAMGVAQLSMASIAPALARDVAAGRDDLERYSRAALVVPLLLMSITAASAFYWVAAAFGAVPDRTSFLILGWLIAVVYPFYFGLKSMMFSTAEVSAYAVAELSADVVFVAVLAVTAAMAPGLALASFVVAYGAFSIVIGIRMRRRRCAETRLGPWRPILRYSGGSLIATYSSVALFPIIIVLSERLDGASTAATVAAGMALVMPIYLVPQAASALTFAKVARSLGRSHSSTVRQSIRIVGTASAISALVAVALLRPVTEFVLGERYRGVATGLAILFIALIPQLVAMPIASAFAAEGSITLKALISVCSLVVGVAVALVAVPTWHSLGSFVAAGVAVVSSGVLSIALTRGRYAVTSRDLLGPAVVLISAVACGVAVGEPALRVAVICGGLAAGVVLIVRDARAESLYAL